MDITFIYHYFFKDAGQRILVLLMVMAAIWCIYILGRFCIYILGRFGEDLRDWREQRVEGVRVVIAFYWLSLIPVGGWLVVNFIRLWTRA